MPTYEPSIIHDNLGNLNMTTWIPSPNSSEPALRPIDDQLEGGAMSCCICVDDNDPRIAHFWSRLNTEGEVPKWEFVQGFAENEEVYCTLNSTVIEDKVLLSSTDYFFSGTVQKQLESWLMVIAVAQADCSALLISPGESDAHADFDLGTFPINGGGVYVYESENDGSTWEYKSQICFLPPLDNGDADEAITYPIPFSFGQFPTPSSIFISGGSEATPVAGDWFVVVPYETYRQKIEYSDCDDNLISKTRYTRAWTPAGFYSSDGTSWQQLKIKEFLTVAPCDKKVELVWYHWDAYSLNTGGISRNLWGRDGDIPVCSIESRTSFESSDTDGWWMIPVAEDTVDMEYFWGTGNDWPNSSPALADRAYLFIHDAFGDYVLDYDPFGDDLSGGIEWTDANLGSVGSTGLIGPQAVGVGQPLWVKLRDHAVVLDAHGLFSVRNAATASSDGWSVGFLPGGG